MINVTEYLKANQLYSSDKIKNFLRLTRVKYLIAKNDWVVISKSGKYNGGTFFSEGLFNIYKSWILREPIPLLNRKEYEVNNFLKTYYGADLYSQVKHGEFVYDWHIKSIDVFIEFNENTHNVNNRIIRDRTKLLPNQFTIHENSVMSDLAALVKKYPCHK